MSEQRDVVQCQVCLRSFKSKGGFTVHKCKLPDEFNFAVPFCDCFWQLIYRTGQNRTGACMHVSVHGSTPSG